MKASAPRILLSGTASGVGKTTVVCGLLRAFSQRGMCVRACKCGPDYLDPQFHRSVLGVPSCNLDMFLGGEGLVRELVAFGVGGASAGDADLTVIEGAMGYYDGIAQSHDASAYDVARVTNTPVVLVVDARGRSLSLAAEVAGFVRFREPSWVAGVILNRASAAFAPMLKAMIEEHVGVPVLGYVPQLDDVGLEHRHLGLVAANEVGDLQRKLDLLANELQKTVDLDALMALARRAKPLQVGEPGEARAIGVPVSPVGEDDRPVIAVARDEAFSFYYEETLQTFERLGARLAFFSPLRDKGLPSGTCGLYVGGGYPELHARGLSENVVMRKEVRAAIADGMPTIAECGGFLYLHQELEDANGTAWPQVGAVPGRAFRTDRLRRFGYVTLTARHDGLLARAGERLPAHEFHYWDSKSPGDAFYAQKPQSTRGWDCGVSTATMYAGFPHLYLAGQPEVAVRFVRACVGFGDRAVRKTGGCR